MNDAPRKKDTRFKPGNPGRPKGSKNKVTQSIRQAIEEAFERKGGAAYLATLDDNVFVPLVGRLLPLQVEGGDPNRPVVMRWQNEDESAPE